MGYLNDDGVEKLWQKIKENYVTKETGKGLSTNDYSDEEKEKLQNLATSVGNIGSILDSINRTVV